MSKNVSIKEGDRARNFGPTAKIKTELQAGGSCYWVPEDERETGHIFASENREYTPDEINKYGIDSIDVNIIFTGITIDGDPWSVTIDPDTGLPIIDIDDVEITIDDVTGDIDISTPDIDTTIDDADLDDFGIDPDADIDISIDNLGNVEISDGDISIDFDPETGEWDTEDCPASIKIMHVPDKTSYKDGESIDIDGLVVESFDQDGNSLGYIPAHKLSLSQTSANYADGTPQYEIPDYSEDVTSVTSIGNASELFKDSAEKIREAVPKATLTTLNGLGDVQNRLGQCDGVNVAIVFPYTPPDIPWGSSGATGNAPIAFVFDPLPSTVVPGVPYPGTTLMVSYNWATWGDDPFVNISMDEKRGSHALFCGEKDGAISTANMTRTGGNTNDISVDWTSPCFQQFSGSFTISVSADHGGSHHSGKF